MMKKTIDISVQGFILAGGASSRMGTNKAGIEIGGTSLVRRAADTLSEVTDSVIVVGASAASITDMRLPVIEDVPAETRGAIRGLVTALKACERIWALVLACDLPFISSELLKLLIEKADPDVDAIVPVQQDGRYQLLCGVFRRETCLPAASQAMLEGRWSLHALAERLNTRRIEPAEYVHLPASDRFFMNMNSPDDLIKAQEIYGK